MSSARPSSARTKAARAAVSPWRGRQSQRDRDSKREAVIQAAARAFNRNGFHNTSLDDIAAALEVTKPTLYYYVRNKELLLFECFRTGLEPIRSALRDAQSPGRPAHERLTDVLLHYAQAIASDYGWCMVRAEDLSLAPDLQEQVKSFKSEIDQGIRRLLREGVQDGSIAACDPKMTAFALAGALNWIAHWYRDNQSLSAAEIAESFVQLFDRGLRPRTL